MRDTVLCDMDGTLIDTEQLKCLSWKLAIEEWDPDLQIDLEEHRSFYSKKVGQITDKVAQVMIEHYRLTISVVELKRLRKKWKDALYQDDSKLRSLAFKETLSFVQKMFEKGWKIFLVTTDDTYAERIISLLDLADVFEDTICGLPKSRHNPACYREALKKARKSPSQCIAIEDSTSGAEAANQLGIVVLVIPNEFTMNQPFTSADIIIRNRRMLRMFDF